MSGWVVIRVRPQYLQKAEVNVRNQGAEFYAPRAMVRSPRTWQRRVAPLFPGYAFVRHPAGRWTFLRGTLGVLDVLMGTGEAPGYLPQVEINRLRAREGPDGLVRLEAREFRKGEKVRVERGAVHLDALVDGMAARERIYVLLDVLGRLVRAEVDVRNVIRE